MATWQYDLLLLPRRAIEKRFGQVPVVFSRDEFEAVECWWCDEQLSFDVANFVASFLPARKHWNADTQAYGDEVSNTIELRFEENKIESIFIRLDASRADETLLQNIAELSARCEAVILTEEDFLLQPDVRILASHLAGSRAARFVNDPHAFLKEIAADAGSLKSQRIA